MLRYLTWSILPATGVFFFSILPVLATFWIAKTPIFFPFSNSQFLRTGTRRTYIHPFDLDYWAKTRYQPIFRHFLGAVLQYLAIFYKICTKSRNLGWKPRKFQQSRRCFGSRNCGTDASHVRMGLRNCVMTPWRHEYIMSSKTGNVFRR